jgi:RHS repeat-associated protein
MEGNDYELTFPDGTVYAYKVPTGSLLWAFLTQIRDPHGNNLTLQWEGLSPWGGRLMGIRDATGRTTTFFHDANDRVASIHDPFGRFASLTYDDAGNLTAIRDMGGFTTTFTYDGNGLIQTMNQGGNRWTFQTDATSMTVTDNLGTEKFTLDAAQNKGEYQGPTGGGGVAYAYTQQTAPDGRHKDITGFKTPEGVDFTFAYDPKGNILTDTLKAAGGDETATFTYNAKGKVTSVRDARGALAALTYASNQVDLIKLEDGLGVIAASYNDKHDIVSLTDRTGATKSYVYNAFGQVTQTVDALGVLTTFVYDADYRLIRIERAGTTVSAYEYDAIGRVAAHTDVNGHKLRYAYNNLDDLVSITYPDGHQTLYGRSAVVPHLLESITDQAGKTTVYRYNAHQKLERIIDPQGGETRLYYNGAGHAIELKDPNGHNTAFEYDKDSRLVKKRFADGSSQGFTYTNGRLTRSTNARGMTTDYTYDKNGNLLTIRYSDGTPDVTITYDAANRPIVIEDGLGTHRKSYDAASRVTAIDGPWDNDTLTFVYDARGRKTSETLQMGVAATYSYDDLDRLTAVAGAGFTYTYSYQGGTALLEKLERSDGSRTDYGYDTIMKRLQRLTNRNRGGEVLSEYRLAFDALGQPIEETVVNGPALDFSRMQTDLYTYNQLNQPVSLNGSAAVFAHDADGNMTRGLTGDGRPFEAAYDAENRLTSIQYTDGAGILQRQEYLYGSDGLIGVSKRYAAGVLTDELRFIRHAGKILQERNGANLPERTYLWGLAQTGGVGALLALVQNGGTYQYFSNTRGDITAVLDSSGAVVAAYADDIFGVPMAMTGAFQQPMRFSTKRRDEKTGLYDFGYRLYCPRFGRWLSRDPLAETASINLYGFAGGNPVARFDPFGAADFSWMRPEHRAQAEAQLEQLRAARAAEKTWGDKVSEGLSSGFKWIGDKIKGNPEVTQKVVDTVVDTALESNEYTKAGKEWNDRINKGIEMADDLREVKMAIQDKDPASGLTLLKKVVKYTCGRIPTVGSAVSDVMTKGIQTVETAPGGVQASQRQSDWGSINISAAKQMPR